MSGQHTMSPDLIAFLKAWYDWATNGAPDGKPFSRGGGLCANAFHFVPVGQPVFLGEMEKLFGGGRFPFGAVNYDDRNLARTQHECPKRLAWVRERLIEAGELVS